MGSADGIKILPLDCSRHALVGRFEAFDAALCDCFLPADKERLLAVVRAAFGGNVLPLVPSWYTRMHSVDLSPTRTPNVNPHNA